MWVPTFYSMQNNKHESEVNSTLIQNHAKVAVIVANVRSVKTSNTSNISSYIKVSEELLKTLIFLVQYSKTLAEISKKDVEITSYFNICCKVLKHFCRLSLRFSRPSGVPLTPQHQLLSHYIHCRGCRTNCPKMSLFGQKNS